VQKLRGSGRKRAFRSTSDESFHTRLPIWVLQCEDPLMGGVNCCTSSLHCRLAKFRGLIIMWKYCAVIGQKTRFFCMCLCIVWISRLRVLLSQSQRRISPWSSNHGISPNYSVNYSGWPLPLFARINRAAGRVV